MGGRENLSFVLFCQARQLRLRPLHKIAASGTETWTACENRSTVEGANRGSTEEIVEGPMQSDQQFCGRGSWRALAA